MDLSISINIHNKNNNNNINGGIVPPITDDFIIDLVDEIDSGAFIIDLTEET